jgi:hypothetical protein
MVLAEIACVRPRAPREQTLGDMALLGQAHVASWTEVMAFIAGEKLDGLGCGVVDTAPLANACITPGAKLWTLDKKLLALATQFGVQFELSLH